MKRALSSPGQRSEPSVRSYLHRILLSVLLGLIGFAGSFFAPVFVIPPHTISITWYHIFPLLAAIGYGPRYGFLTGVIGLAAFSPFIAWPTNGWANIVPVAFHILFYVWHGYCAEAQRRKSSWWNNPFIAQIFYAIVYGVATFFLYPVLFSFNPPCWAPTAVSHMPEPVIIGIILKSTATMFWCVLVAEFIFMTPVARRLLGISFPQHARFNGRIFLVSIFTMTFMWFLGRILNSIFAQTAIPQRMFQTGSHHDAIMLFVVTVTCTLGGYIIALFMEKRVVAEDSLGESEEKYRNIFENMQDVYYETSIDGTILEVSPSIEMMSKRQYHRDDLIGKPIVDFYTYAGERQSFLTLLLEQGVVADYELSLKNRDGSTVSCSISAKIQFDAQGTPLKTIGNMRDISERTKAEKALRESEEKYRTLIETASDAIILINNYIFIDCNVKAGEMFGCTKGQIIKQPPYRFFPKVQHDGSNSTEKSMEKMNAALGGQPQFFEWQHIRYDGTPFDAEVSLSAIFTAGQYYLLAIIRDITERKLVEKEKEKLKNQLLQSQKIEAIGQLAGGVAHDFNNMLGVILGRAEVAKHKADKGLSLHTDLEEIIKAAQRSADLTRQLLAFARKQEVSPKVLDLNETVEGMLKMLRRLIGEDIHLAWRPGVNVWPVKMDPSQIDQILANLFVNARDSIAGVGKITVETGNMDFDEDYCAAHSGLVPGDYVLLAVSDDGCGMDKEILGKLFEPFFTTKAVGKGTGLGLATVYGIIKQNNGYIDVYSEPGQGTTITVYLPRHIGKVEPAQTEKQPEPIMRGHETVLVVEDEPALLDVGKLMLEREGYNVLAAGSPAEAIYMADEYTGRIHLLMTDVVMPEMNGRDLAAKMLPLYPNLKLLFTSGYTANFISHHGLSDKEFLFIQKPFSRKDLAAKVREVLDQS